MNYGPRASRIPLFGLIHRVDVVKRVMVDDGAGGVSDTGTPLVLYDGIKCRITTIQPDDEEMQGYGYNAQQHRKIIFPYSPKVSRQDCYVQIPWGIPPNIVSPDTAPDGTASSYSMTHPTGVETLTWDGSKWANGADTMTLEWSAPQWVFTDSINTFTQSIEYAWAGEDVNPWGNTNWIWNPASSYSVSLAVSDLSYRILWHKHQSDEQGGVHHTSAVIELQDIDT